jgi:hypothetical protein
MLRILQVISSSSPLVAFSLPNLILRRLYSTCGVRTEARCASPSIGAARRPDHVSNHTYSRSAAPAGGCYELDNHRRQRGHRQDILNDLRAWMEQHEYEPIAQMRGSMSQQAVAEPAAFVRANYMRALNTFDARLT